MCQIKMGICRLRDTLALDRDIVCDGLGDLTRDFGPFFVECGLTLRYYIVYLIDFL